MFVNKENTLLSIILLPHKNYVSHLSAKNAVDHDYHKALQ